MEIVLDNPKRICAVEHKLEIILSFFGLEVEVDFGICVIKQQHVSTE